MRARCTLTFVQALLFIIYTSLTHNIEEVSRCTVVVHVRLALTRCRVRDLGAATHSAPQGDIDYIQSCLHYKQQQLADDVQDKDE